MDHDIRIDEIQAVKCCISQIGVSVSKHGSFRFGLDVQTIAVAKRKSIENVSVVIMTTPVAGWFCVKRNAFCRSLRNGQGCAPPKCPKRIGASKSYTTLVL